MMISVFVSCKKEDNTDVAISLNVDVDTGNVMAISTPENLLNPYDSTGYLHNRIVAYLLSCKGNTPPDANVSTQYVLKFYEQSYGIDLPATFFATVSSTVNKSRADIQNIIAGCSYDQMLKLKLDSLMQIINKLSDDNSRYSVIKTAIAGFENEIMLDKLLSAEDSEAILKITSIARFSIYYWMNVFKEPFSSATFSIKNIVKWIAATTSDIAGAIVSGNDVVYAADCSAYAYDLITYSMP